MELGGLAAFGPIPSEWNQDALLVQHCLLSMSSICVIESSPHASSSLMGKRLGCWYKPNLCHGDVLVKLVRQHLEMEDFEEPTDIDDTSDAKSEIDSDISSKTMH